LTTDELYGLIQIGIMFLGILAFVLIFVYLAYEKPSS
jgi:hypothetical protein